MDGATEVQTKRLCEVCAEVTEMNGAGIVLLSGQVRLGALNLYRDRPGPLTDEQHADALAMAEIVTRAVLVMQSNAPSGQLAAELAKGADFEYVVHQASGMVAAQLDVSVAQALI